MLEMTITIKTLFKIIFWLCLIWAVVSSIKLDSTDKNIFNRSDLKLHIDNKTGCHYLSTWTGHLYPRLDKNGEHICEGYEYEG